MKTISMNLLKRKMAVLWLLVFLITACTPATSVIQTVEVTRLVPEVIIATLIIRETVVVTPESTVPSTSIIPLTPTPSPSSTLTSTPQIAFPNAKIIGYGYRADGELFLTIDTGQSLTGDFMATVGDLEFDCDLVPNYPERLYCYGPLKQYGRIVKLQIFAGDIFQQTLVFETEFSAPLKSSPTATPTLSPTPTP